MVATVFAHTDSTVNQANEIGLEPTPPSQLEEPAYLITLWNLTLHQSLSSNKRRRLEHSYFTQHTRWKSFQARLVTAIADVGTSEFWNTMCKAVSDHGYCGDGLRVKVDEVVCLCIGHLDDSASQYQLALLILLLEKLGVHHNRCLIYDPCHSGQDADILEYLGFTLLAESFEGRMCAQHMTLFYMPHGDHYLTNNLISANLNMLHHVAILGNNLAWVCDPDAAETDCCAEHSNSITSRAPFVQKVLPLVKETHIQDTLASKVRSQVVMLAPSLAKAGGSFLPDFLDCTLSSFPRNR